MSWLWMNTCRARRFSLQNCFHWTSLLMLFLCFHFCLHLCSSYVLLMLFLCSSYVLPFFSLSSYASLFFCFCPLLKSVKKSPAEKVYLPLPPSREKCRMELRHGRGPRRNTSRNEEKRVHLYKYTHVICHTYICDMCISLYDVFSCSQFAQACCEHGQMAPALSRKASPALARRCARALPQLCAASGTSEDLEEANERSLRRSGGHWGGQVSGTFALLTLDRLVLDTKSFQLRREGMLRQMISDALETLSAFLLDFLWIFNKQFLKGLQIGSCDLSCCTLLGCAGGSTSLHSEGLPKALVVPCGSWKSTLPGWVSQDRQWRKHKYDR